MGVNKNRTVTSIRRSEKNIPGRENGALSSTGLPRMDLTAVWRQALQEEATNILIFLVWVRSMHQHPSPPFSLARLAEVGPT